MGPFQSATAILELHAVASCLYRADVSLADGRRRRFQLAEFNKRSLINGGQRSSQSRLCGNQLTTGSDGQLLTCLTVNEIRRMHAIFCRPDWSPEHHLNWSRWRRRHHATARQCRYQRRNQRDH